MTSTTATTPANLGFWVQIVLQYKQNCEKKADKWSLYI